MTSPSSPQRLPVVRLGIFLCELGGDGAEIFGGLLGRYAGLQSTDDGDRGGCAVVQEVVAPELLFVQHGDPVVGPDEALGAVKLRGSDANDGERMLVELDGGADDCRVGVKRAAPESIAQDQIRRGVGAVLVGGVEEAACLRFDAEEVEVVAGDFVAVDFDGCVMPEQCRAGVSIDGGQSREGGVALAKVLEVGIRGRDEAEARPCLVAELVEALRVAHFKRVEQDGVEHAEDDDVGPDAEGEGDERGCGESWRALQLAQGVAEVAGEAVEDEGGVGGGLVHEDHVGLDDSRCQVEGTGHRAPGTGRWAPG
jgi:hypothetical protein